MTPESSKKETEAPSGIIIPKKAVDLAKKIGVDLEPLVGWAQGVEARLQASFKAIETLGVKLGPLVAMAERAQATANAEQPAPGKPGVDVGGIIAAALSGGGTNPLQEKTDKFMNLMLDQAIANINKPSKIDQYLEEEIAKAKAKALAAAIM
ncbi:hypothetical protein KAR91_45840 [Candidatus Pacearchaeota archaeon]|nr:hypothetical protein [Candidatus Pacearchaeota archaeon]